MSFTYLLAAAVMFSPQASSTVTGEARVRSGDAIQIGEVRVHLFGAEAPDLIQACRDAQGQSYNCGESSARALLNLVQGQQVECSIRAPDSSRIRAQCFIDGRDLGKLMVERGHALASADSDLYEASESEARAARRGLWAGTFMKPSEWRSRMADFRPFATHNGGNQTD